MYGRRYMRKFLFLAMLTANLSQGDLQAEECTEKWDLTLSTDPAIPKPFSGDGNAAYGVLGWRGDKNLKFVLKGEYPWARFMSLSSMWSKKHYPVDAILDTQIQPDEGSRNPYIEGTPLDTTPRNYTIEALPNGVSPTPGLKNVIRLPDSRLYTHVFMFRIFSPNAGLEVKPEWFPRIFAYNLKGEPIACPKQIDLPHYFKFPEFLTIIVPRKTHFEFKEANILWGPNVAIPKYTYAVNPMVYGEEVIVVRFKAPVFMRTISGTGPMPILLETRYWSLCTQDYPKNETRGCLPDYLTKLDSKGFVNVVIGHGDDVRQAAETRGLNFINDSRGPKQFVVGFNYRNLVVDPVFAQTRMYQGDYLPKGVLCSREEFLEGKCH